LEYEGTVYRPPSEANSLIIQVTIGCSHNSCTFCSMYKGKQFRIKDVSVVKNELKEYRKMYKSVKRIFLADGDAFILKTKDLIEILSEIKDLFPECERISSYATPHDILNKSDEDINLLRDYGLTLLYMGVESGSDMILLSPKEVMVETYEFIKNLKVSNCLFRSNHASNYVSLGGNLNRDKEKILNQIKTYLNDRGDFKDERYRAL